MQSVPHRAIVLPACRRSVGRWGLFVLCGIAAVTSGCGRRQEAADSGAASQEKSDRRPQAVVEEWQPPSGENYVGSQACAECHADLYDSYMGHPMARSLRPVDVEQEAKIVNGTEQVAGAARTYEIVIDGGQLIHHEKMYDHDGVPIYDQAVPVDYVVGSGRRGYAYLYQHDDLLFMSPLNFYSDAQTWDLAPGYLPDDPRRFDRRVTEECLSCHAGRVAVAERGVNRYQQPAFLEQGIGCEKCHGPGAAHVAIHAEGASLDEATDPIVNPVDLSAERREDVCAACHLSAEARVPRYGRSDLDFRPGDRLEDIWTVLVAGKGVVEEGKTKAVSHVQQMRQSLCFVRSDGRMGCISCHDPHSIPAPAERVDFYRDRCLRCHQDDSCTAPAERRHERDDSCIACHMPRGGSSNVAHVTLTDHRVLRRYDSPDDDSASEEDSLVFFDDAHERLPAWEQSRALGIGAWMHLRKSGRTPAPSVARLLVNVLEVVPEDGVVLTVLGAMAMDHNRPDLARTYYERARDIPQAREAALLGLMKIDYLTGRPESALEFADQLLAINPLHARAHAMRADLLKSLGQRKEGIAAAERALSLNPTLMPLREWLAETCGEEGQTDKQETQQEIIRRMEQKQAGP